MNARKAHNTGRNHISNVRDYFASLGHDTAQSIIDQIIQSHENGGRAAMMAAPSMRLGAGFMNPMAPGMPSFSGFFASSFSSLMGHERPACYEIDVEGCLGKMGCRGRRRFETGGKEMTWAPVFGFICEWTSERRSGLHSRRVLGGVCRRGFYQQVRTVYWRWRGGRMFSQVRNPQRYAPTSRQADKPFQ